MDERLLKADTIIFDIGRVLIDFHIEDVASHLLPKRLQGYVKDPFFIEQWLELDAGTTDTTRSSNLVCNKFNLDGDESLFKNIMENFCTVCKPLPLSNEIRELRGLGKRVYLLTNYGEESFNASNKQYKFLQDVDGEVVSAIEKVCKPDKKIYEILINRYDIDKTKAVYIDDKLENIQSARQLGIESILYPDEYNEQ